MLHSTVAIRGSGMRIFGAQTSGGTLLEFEAYFLGKFVYRAHPVCGSALQVRDLQRHFTRKKQRRNRALEFISQSLAYFLPHQKDLFGVPAERGAQLASNSVHAVDGKVHVNGNGRSNVFQYQVALDRLGLQERVIY